MNKNNILVVGNKDVGKTTFINTFCDYYNQKKHKIETNIIIYEFTKESKIPENIDLIIYIIDIFTKSYDDIEYWIFEINKPYIPKIFLANKCDLYYDNFHKDIYNHKYFLDCYTNPNVCTYPYRLHSNFYFEDIYGNNDNNKIIYLGNKTKFNKKNIFDEILEMFIK